MIWLTVLALGLVAGTLSGIVGFGASIMLMPALMLAFGPHEAVPIMAIAALLANFSRVLVWWREVDWRANAYYCATAIPCAALGARTLLVLDPRVVEGILGGYVPADDPGTALADGARACASRPGICRWWAPASASCRAWSPPPGRSTRLSSWPTGWSRAPTSATEALGSMAIGLTKAIVFQRFDALPLETVGRGLLIGGSLMVGSRLAKGFVLRLDANQFRLLMDLLLAGAGLVLLWGAFVLPHS